jgi:tetratricopeptide (TPR) repeat protein
LLAAGAAGLVCGLAALVRPNVLALVVVSLLWIGWVSFRDPERKRRRWAPLIMLALGAGLAILPTTVRNYRVAGEFVPISSNVGINLFIGNNDQADGLVATEIEDLGTFRTCFDWPELVRSVERRLGRELTDSDVSSYFTRRSVEFIRKNPGRFTGLTVRKAMLFWGPVEVGHNKEIHFERRQSSVLKRLPGEFAAVLALALVGFSSLALAYARDRRSDPPAERSDGQRWDMTVLVALWVVSYFVSVLPFFAAARYRVPILPLLMLFAAYTLDRLVSFVRQRNVRAGLLTLFALVGVYTVTTRSFADHQPSLARWTYDRGTDYDRIGDAERARQQYERAIDHRADFFEAHYNLGHKLNDLGQTDRAIEHWHVAATLHPNFAPVHYNLARALARSGRIDSALEQMARATRLSPRSLSYRMEYGDLLAAAGRLGPALGQYEAAIAIEPRHVPAMRNLAWLLAVHPDPASRDPVRAVELGERAAALSSGQSPTVFDALAAAYAAQGRWDDALGAASKAIELAHSAGQEDLARKIRARMDSYERQARP